MASTCHTDDLYSRKVPAQLSRDGPLPRRDAGPKTQLSVTIVSPRVELSVGCHGNHVRSTSVGQVDDACVRVAAVDGIMGQRMGWRRSWQERGGREMGEKGLKCDVYQHGNHCTPYVV